MKFCLVCWECAWEINAGITSGGYEIRNMSLVWNRRNFMSLVGKLYGGV